mgnify:CR=1 FL=1
MINDENEVQDVDLDTTTEEAEEDTVEVVEDTVEVEEEKGVEYWKAEALKNKAILERNKEKPVTKSKTDDFGYDKKAYLKSSGIEAKEFDFVQSELKQSGLKDLDALLENDYFKAKLEKHRELSKTADATPTGKRSGGVATDSVEYWMSKPIEEVPKDMRIKVVNERLKQSESKGVFYNS